MCMCTCMCQKPSLLSYILLEVTLSHKNLFSIIYCISHMMLNPRYFLPSFKVCKSVHHRTIQINHQPEATVFQLIILTFIYMSTCFGRSPAYHQELNDCSGSLWFYLRIVQIVVLCSWSGRLTGPTTNTARLSPRDEG